MKQKFLFLAKYSLVWITFFIIIKIIFLLVNYQQSFTLFALWPRIIFNGLLMDFSMWGYIIALPLFLLIINTFISGKWYAIVTKVYTYILLVLFSFVVVADLVIYPEWGFRLDVGPFFYLKNPEGVLASITLMQTLLYAFYSLLIPIPFVLLFKRVFKGTHDFNNHLQWITAPVLLLFMGTLIIPIRGGVSASTMNTGNAYFSENTFANHAALNVFWNILYSFANMDDYHNPMNNKIEHILTLNNQPDCPSDSTTSLLTTPTPNIVLVILESFSARLMENVCPDYKTAVNLNRLADSGIFFSNIYASGDRSDKGLVSILSGYPSQPTTSIIKYPNKTEKLPGLANSLAKRGYSSTLYYGGDINFASMKSYFVNCGFQKLVHIQDFKPSKRISSWGVPDEYVFDKVFEDIKTAREPYLKTIFTLSSHTPYDVPGKVWIEGKDDESKFLNSVCYTDFHLGSFISKLEKNGLLENTLVILTADHGALLPGPVTYVSKEKYHIPLIFYGPVLKEKGIVIDKIGSQTDLPATLLGQLQLNSSAYHFSRNMLCPRNEGSAYFAISRGFSYISNHSFIRYSIDNNKFSVVNGEINDSLKFKAKSYYYNLYEDFLGLN